MDGDELDQDANRATAHDQQTKLAILASVPPLPLPSSLQSTTAPNSQLDPPSPHRSAPSYVAIIAGASMPTTNASGTAALAAILESAQTGLQVVVQASVTLRADQLRQAP